MSKTYIDISVPVEDRMVHWPTDPPVSIRVYKAPEQGDRSTVSLLSMGSHTGTHVDAPRHFLPEREGVDAIDLHRMIGPCLVVDCTGKKSIGLECVQGLNIEQTPRILFKTHYPEDKWWENEFSTNYTALEPDAARWLVSHGAVLVGIDGLSIEKYEAPTPETHNALLAAGLVILEGLNLREAVAGAYQLICLPLRLRNCDGSPARAILLRD